MRLLFFSSRLLPFWLVGLALLVLLADYFTGPALQFPIFYILPVMLAAWHRGLPLALFLTVLMPLVRVFFEELWGIPYLLAHLIVNTATHLLILGLLAVLTERVARQMRLLAREVRQLTGLLPICAFCKKIRSPENEWVNLERYISEHSQAEFSHGYCPECAQKHFGEYLKRPAGQKKPG